jgi:hypothetical protein
VFQSGNNPSVTPAPASLGDISLEQDAGLEDLGCRMPARSDERFERFAFRLAQSDDVCPEPIL